MDINHRNLKVDREEKEVDVQNQLITQLKNNGYEELSDLNIKDNLRKQIENLNNFKFSQSEWERFIKDIEVKNKKNLIYHKDYSVQVCTLDDGNTKNLTLIDSNNISRNKLQFIKEFTDGNNRFDLMILLNGLPIILIELKSREVNLNEAFRQANRYLNNLTNKFLECLQICIISNNVDTRYYSRDDISGFKFTSYWSDEKNNRIHELNKFTNTFLKKENLLAIITKYFILTADNQLKIMRPYQIEATKCIIKQINKAYENNLAGTKGAGGYIWHSTGSGKTLTSFKASKLAGSLKFIDKAIFVVDRMDLNDQTIREFNHFERGSVDYTNNTADLDNKLKSKKIVVTTIQKLNRLIINNASHPIYDKHVVLIFDEYHRSQFGKMHKNIINHFKNYYLFGFTGTPIFKENSLNNIYDTRQIFGERLHSYTIIEAVNDKKVLGFHLSFHSAMKIKEDIEDKQVEAIDERSALHSKRRIDEITKYIINNFDSKSKGRKFNALLAVDSIEAAKVYYNSFKEHNNNIKDEVKRLKVGIIYSATNEQDKSEDDDEGFLIEENVDSMMELEKGDMKFLQTAINDFNIMFKESHKLDNMDNYNKAVSMKLKGFNDTKKTKDKDKRNDEKRLDLLIVVNMFLTGFDSAFLNTLYLDKNLKQHGLMQAISRTNRPCGEIKEFGQIICFRDLRGEIDKSIEMFGDKDAASILLTKTYGEYYNNYKNIVKQMREEYPNPDTLELLDDNIKDFRVTLKETKRLMNILESFDEFKDANRLLTKIEMQNYDGLNNRYKNNRSKKIKENIEDDIEYYSLEEHYGYTININYILHLFKQYMQGDKNSKKEILIEIKRELDADPKLYQKKDLIIKFMEHYSSNVLDIKTIDKEQLSLEFNKFQELKGNKYLEELIKKYDLKEEVKEEAKRRLQEQKKFTGLGNDINNYMNLSWFDEECLVTQENVMIELNNYIMEYEPIDLFA